MKYIYQTSKTILILSLMMFSVSQVSAQCGQRYHDKIFLDSSVTNIQYGANLKSNGTNQNLLLDMYFPKGDNLTDRPLIIIIHGGNFLGGSKAGSDVKPLAQDWARMGYVVASIEYRVGMTNFPLPGPDSTDAGAAVMRAVHDSRASVRFFKNSFANGNPYGIDTSLIFFGGVSAGAITALHLGYMDELPEFPSYIDTVGQPGLSGGIEGSSNSYPYNSKVKAIFNICGAIGDTAWMKAGDVPVLSFHGDLDATVPFGSDVITLLGLYPLLEVDGSESVTQRANEMGIENCFEIHEGQDHTPHVVGSLTTQYYDTTLNISRNFFARYVCNEALVCSYGPTITSVMDVEQVQNMISVYPNPATNLAEIILHEYRNGSELSMYDMHGKLILSQTVTSSKITIPRNNLPAGIYFVKVSDGEKTQTAKLVFE